MRHLNLREWLQVAESVAKNYGGTVYDGTIRLVGDGVLRINNFHDFDVLIELRGAPDEAGSLAPVARASHPPTHHDPAVLGAISRAVSVVTDRAVVALELVRDFRVSVRSGEYGDVFCDLGNGSGVIRARVGTDPCPTCSGTGARPSTVRPPPLADGA